MGSSSSKERQLLLGNPTQAQMQEISRTYNIPMSGLNLLKQRYAMYKSKNGKVNIFNYLILYREFINANANDTEVYKSFNAFDKDRDGFLNFIEMIRAMTMQTPVGGQMHSIQQSLQPPPQPQQQIIRTVMPKPVFIPAPPPPPPIPMPMPMHLPMPIQLQEPAFVEYVSPLYTEPQPLPLLQLEPPPASQQQRITERVIYKKRSEYSPEKYISPSHTQSYRRSSPLRRSSSIRRSSSLRGSSSRVYAVNSRHNRNKYRQYFAEYDTTSDNTRTYDYSPEQDVEPEYYRSNSNGKYVYTPPKRKGKVRKVTVYVPKQRNYSPVIERRLFRSKSTNNFHYENRDYNEVNDDDDHKRRHRHHHRHYDDDRYTPRNYDDTTNYDYDYGYSRESRERVRR